MVKYLLNVTFFAGSDEPEDVDKGLFVLSLDGKANEEEIKNIFIKANKLLDPFNEEIDFPISYDDGLNLDTLMKGVEMVAKGKIAKLENNCGGLGKVDNYFSVEQWQ